MSDHILWLPPISHLAPHTHGDHARPRTLAGFQFLAPAQTTSTPEALLPRTVAPDAAAARRAQNFPVHAVEPVLPLLPPHEADRLVALRRLVVSKQYSAPVLEPVRAHLSVYEYQVGLQWIIWDHETGNVLLTSLWRAAQECQPQRAPAPGTHATPRPAPKADIVKLLESTPKPLQSSIKRVRGGFLKIQGTWVPFEFCRRLARRFCYHIRFQLVPLFGAAFPGECVSPGAAGFGELRYGDLPRRAKRARRSRRAAPALRTPETLPRPLLPRPLLLRPLLLRALLPRALLPRALLPRPLLPCALLPLLPQAALFHRHTLPPALVLPLPPALVLPLPALPLAHIAPAQVAGAPPLTPLLAACVPAAALLSPLQWHHNSPAARPEYIHCAPDGLGRSAVPRQPKSDAPVSYAEMVDIVNASHCLQRLSQAKMRIDNLVE